MPDVKRCVITGLGLVCAIGNDTDECFESALKGRSGIADVKCFDTSNCYSHKGAEVDIATGDLAGGRYDRTTALGIKAAGEAIADSGLDMDSEEASGIGVILGSCIAGAVAVEKYYQAKENGGKGSLEDLKAIPASVIAGNVADYYKAGGITANIVNACAAGTLSVALAIDLIRGGKGEIFLAGGCDAFDFVLIDCPPSFTASSVAAIYAADDIIIPTEADLFSITGLTTLVKQVESVRRFKPNIRVAGALITKWHNTAACIQGECALRGSAVPVFRQTIRRSDKVTESIFAGQALQAYSPQSAAGRDYRAFVAEYLEEVR